MIGWGGGAARLSTDRDQLRGGRVPVLDVRPRRFLGAVVGDQALLMQRRRRARVAAIPRGPHPELVEGPVDRAAEPRLRREDAEVEVDEVLLEGPGALLLHRAVTV